MKKFISVLVLSVAFLAVTLAANVNPLATESGSTNVREGRNVVRLRSGSTLLFVVRLGEISDVELRQPTGRVIKFEDDACPTCANPQPPKPCNGELRCVYSEKYKTTICFCVPDLDFSNGGGTLDYHIKLADVLVSSNQ